MDILSLAHEFGAMSALDGQGTMDSDTGAPRAQVLSAVRDHAEGMAPATDEAIVTAWLAGFASVAIPTRIVYRATGAAFDDTTYPSKSAATVALMASAQRAYLMTVPA